MNFSSDVTDTCSKWAVLKSRFKTETKMACVPLAETIPVETDLELHKYDEVIW